MERLYVTGKGAEYAVACDRMLAQGYRIHFASVVGPHALVRGALAALSSGGWVRAGEEMRTGIQPARHFYAALARPDSQDGCGRASRVQGLALAHGLFVGETILRKSDGGIVCLDPSPERLLARLRREYTLCILPEWAGWLLERLPRALSEWEFARLDGWGVSGILLRADEARIQELISEGVRKGELTFGARPTTCSTRARPDSPDS